MNNTTNPMFAKFDQVLGKTTPTTANGPISTRANEIRALAKTAVNNPPSDPNDPNNFLKIKANPNASFDDSSGIKDVLETPLKSIANFATFPLRAANTAGAAFQAGTDLVKEQGPVNAAVNENQALLDMSTDMAKKGYQVLSSIGNTFLGALQAGIKKTTGVDVGDKEAKKAIDTLSKHLMDNKLADATTVASTIHKWVTENPEQVMLAAQQLNKIAGQDVVSETAKKFGSDTIQAGVDNTIDAAGNVVSAGGRALKGFAEKLYEHAITPNTQEAENLLDYRSKTPFLQRVKNTLTGEAEPPQTRASTALEKGIAGTEGHIGTEARAMKNEIWNEQLGPALKDSKAIMAKDDLFSSAAKRVSDTVEPAKRAAFQDAYDALQDEYKDINNIPAQDVQSIKSTLDKFTPDKLWRGKPVANEYNVLRADMANDARHFIYDALPGDVRGTYADWSNLNDLEDVGVKAISNAGMKGGAGTMVSHFWDAATTPVKTVGGQVLYKVGNAFEFLGDKGIKTFGDFLSGKGFSPPFVGGSEVTSPNTQGPNNGPNQGYSDNNVNHVSNPSTNVLGSQEGKGPNMEAGAIKLPFADETPAGGDSMQVIQNRMATANSPQMNTITPPKAGSIEALGEQVGGWKPGMKKAFDTALLHGDVNAVKQMIPDVPPDYLMKFALNIDHILGK